MKTIAIVGACGLVGDKLVDLLSDRLPNINVRLFGNSSVGTRVIFRNRPTIIESCERLLNGGIDYALFMATNDVAKEYIPKLVRQGVTCIDNSSAFRLDRDVPLVVPCINGELIKGKKLIANPNCSTIQVVIAINALMEMQPTKMTAVTYQAVSGAGKAGITDLTQQRCYGKLQCFSHPIYDNLIPCIGKVEEDGFTDEEHKLVYESRKILRLPRLKVNSFCARIPITVGHGVFVNLHLKEKVNLAKIRDLLRNAPNVLLFDDAENGIYPMPIMLRNTKYVGVGRITKDPTANAINFFVVADNLLRGASYNALEILTEALKYNGGHCNE
ncbi:MAG: aspartate-semialdehyde dehydrogenase [Clostridiales bacterium]|nr:aspartate-semialdehyde dehydrogenase [Clostridiales bacterium]